MDFKKHLARSFVKYGILTILISLAAFGATRVTELYFEPMVLPSSCKDHTFAMDSEDFKLKQCLDDVWKVIAGSGGSGVENYSDYEADTITKVLEYDDVSAATDLSGGSPNVTSSSQVSGANKFYRLSKDAADRIHEGWAFESETLVNVDTPSLQVVSFKYRTSSNYANGDVQVFLFLGGDNRLEACSMVSAGGTPTNSVQASTSEWAEYECWTTVSSSTTFLRLGLHIATSSSLAFDIDVDRISVSPDSAAPGAIIWPRQQFTPNWTNLTIGDGSQTWYWQRFGDLMHIHGMTVFGATTSISGSVSMANPVSGTTLTQVTNQIVNGVAGCYDASSTGQLCAPSISGGAIRILTGGFNSLSSTVPFTWTTNDRIMMDAWFKVDEWTPGASFSTQELHTKGLFFKGRNGNDTVSSTSATLIDYDTVVESTHGSSVWDAANDYFVVPAGVSGKMRVCFTNRLESVTASEVVLFHINKNGNNEQVMSTSSPNTTFSTHGCATLSVVPGDTISVDVDSTSDASYTVSACGANCGEVTIEQIFDPRFFGVHGPFEVLSSESSAAVVGVGDTDEWIVFPSGTNSIALSPGTWRLDGTLFWDSNGDTLNWPIFRFGSAGGTGTTTAPAVITALSSVTLLNSDVQHRVTPTNGFNLDTSFNLYPMFLRTTAPITVFLNVRASTATPGGTADWTAYITATRLQ